MHRGVDTAKLVSRTRFCVCARYRRLTYDGGIVAPEWKQAAETLLGTGVKFAVSLMS